MSDDNEIIEIGIDSIVDDEKAKKVDIEKDFNYFNPFFLGTSLLLIGIFIIQVQNGLFDVGDSIDMTNLTYKYSNYREGGSIFGIFTSIFLHGGMGHIIGNILFFYIFSLVIDRLFSLEKSVFLFIILGVVAGIPGYFLNDIPSIGASGAIFGLFGVSTVFYFLHKDHLADNLGDMAGVLLVLAFYQLFLGAMYPIIDNTAHISGYVSGALLGYFLLKDKDIGGNAKNIKEEL